ncbi:hypothetical protein GSI_04011 [Ganoderma sinense ZZ0214-1]|uniref:Uncharacterized protein n=1 Tax=Ganoderma sinense ZZ0214-1 TaxID=1077348 RepID=A0A2G8SI12_9APHY|nr:hypothetical protein GSI_04011 [Ganoderma sinense ZZ0214-1]
MPHDLLCVDTRSDRLVHKTPPMTLRQDRRHRDLPVIWEPGRRFPVDDPSDVAVGTDHDVVPVQIAVGEDDGVRREREELLSASCFVLVLQLEGSEVAHELIERCLVWRRLERG